MFKLMIFSIVSLALSSCAHRPVAKNQLPAIDNRLQAEVFKSVKVPEPVLLRLKAKLGETEKTKFNSASKSEVFEGGSLTNTLEESIEFFSNAEIVKLNKDDEFIERVTTSKKDGQIDLHDFAMPELGEELLITFNSHGKILKAGDHSKESLYFVPPISLPRDPVSIGDTWNMNARWITEQGVPLSLRLLSILKGFVDCGQAQTHDKTLTKKEVCADIELSGDVNIDSNLAGVQFQSVWRGRVLFALERGAMVWSLVESHEAWHTEKVHREVRSCLESLLVEPVGLNVWKDDQHKCLIPTEERASQD